MKARTHTHEPTSLDPSHTMRAMLHAGVLHGGWQRSAREHGQAHVNSAAIAIKIQWTWSRGGRGPVMDGKVHGSTGRAENSETNTALLIGMSPSAFS